MNYKLIEEGNHELKIETPEGEIMTTEEAIKLLLEKLEEIRDFIQSPTGKYVD